MITKILLLLKFYFPLQGASNCSSKINLVNKIKLRNIPLDIKDYVRLKIEVKREIEYPKEFVDDVGYFI